MIYIDSKLSLHNSKEITIQEKECGKFLKNMGYLFPNRCHCYSAHFKSDPKRCKSNTIYSIQVEVCTVYQFKLMKF